MPRLEDLLPEGVADSAEFEEALIHRSKGSRNNERLEYLGDAVLGMVIAEALYQKLPEEPEGILSRHRANLVNKEALAELGVGLNLGERVQLGPGELKSGGFRRKSIIADAVEAIIGAVYLTRGFEAAKQFILALYAELLGNLPAIRSLKDPKSRLQEYLQARSIELPEYELVEVTGQAHNQHFRVRCVVDKLGQSAEGEGPSRKKAEQQAAETIIEALEEA